MDGTKVRYVLYRLTPQGRFQYSAAAPDFHCIDYHPESILPLLAIAKAIKSHQASIPELLKLPQFRAFIQHIGRFSLTSSTGLYLIPVNSAESLPFDSAGDVALPEREMRAVWGVAQEQGLDLRESPVSFGSVVPGAKYALLNLLDTGDLNGLSDAIYLEAFRKANEPWSVYTPVTGEFPAPTDNFEAIVISGGEYTAYDTSLPWIPALEAWIRATAASPTKLLGICFGSQIVAQALGGKVTANPSGVYLNKPERVRIAGYLTGLAGGDVETIVTECHNDSVVKLPQGGELLGSSQATDIEIWGIDRKIVCLQGHPEFSAAFMTEYWLPYVTSAGFISSEDSSETIRQYRCSPPDTQFLTFLFNAWLRE